MITIFNRKELILTTEMNRQAQVRDILSQNGIDYTVKTTNLQAAPIVGNSRGELAVLELIRTIPTNIKFMFIKRILKKQHI